MRNPLSVHFSSLFLIVSVALSGISYADTPVFLIMGDGVNIIDAAEKLENQGAHVRQRIPPQILVADLPDSVRAREIQGVKTVYSNVIPLSVLEPMGVVAVAAGTDWNRGMLNTAKSAGASALGAMRALVAQKSLPATTPMTVSATGSSIRATWQPLDGALYYEVEMYGDSALKNRICVSQTNRPEITLPVPRGSGLITVYLRVRGADHVDADGTREEIYGGFSSPVQITVSASSDDGSLAAPTLSSPAADFTSEGFTLILEWNAAGSDVRLQASRSNDFSDTVFDIVVPGSVYVLPSPGLKLGDVLFWRVKAWGSRTSPWSESRRLKIGPPQQAHSDTFINPEAPK